MFGFSLPEVLLIGLIAILLIGPKDMPVAFRSLARAAKKIQGIRRSLQIHLDDLVREADLPSVPEVISDIAAKPERSSAVDRIGRQE